MHMTPLGRKAFCPGAESFLINPQASWDLHSNSCPVSLADGTSLMFSGRATLRLDMLPPKNQCHS